MSQPGLAWPGFVKFCFTLGHFTVRNCGTVAVWQCVAWFEDELKFLELSTHLQSTGRSKAPSQSVSGGKSEIFSFVSNRHRWPGQGKVFVYLKQWQRLSANKLFLQQTLDWTYLARRTLSLLLSWTLWCEITPSFSAWLSSDRRIFIISL